MGPQLARKSGGETLSTWFDQDGYKKVAGAKPDAVLVIGLCGGLTQPLPQSRLVLYTGCLSSAGEPRLDCAPALTSRLAHLLGSGGMICERVIGITSPRIAATRADRLTLAASGAGVVDMESYEFLSVAERARVPAAVLRVVSDSIDSTLPDFNYALNADGALDGRKAFRVALGSPVRTFRLLAQNKRAMRELAAALTIVIGADLTG
jgi:Phosphorylase superfamily